MTGLNARQGSVSATLFFYNRFDGRRRIQAITGFFYRIKRVCHGGDTRFHVSGTAAVEPAVPDLRNERVLLPKSGRLRTDHI